MMLLLVVMRLIVVAVPGVAVLVAAAFWMKGVVVMAVGVMQTARIMKTTMTLPHMLFLPSVAVVSSG